MTAIYHSVTHALGEYINDIPKDTLQKAALAGGIKMAVLVLGHGLPISVALRMSSSGSVATAIYGFVSPIFKRMANSAELSFPLELVRTGIAVLGGMAFASTGYGSVHSLRINLVVNGILSIFHKRDLDSTNMIVM